jgi:hypothetical protein
MPDRSNCEFILATRIPVFSLVLRVMFLELLTSGQLYYLDVMIVFDLYIIPKTLIAQHYCCLICIEI